MFKKLWATTAARNSFMNPVEGVNSFLQIEGSTDRI